MSAAVASALVLYDVDLPDCDLWRQIRIFLDGVYQETKLLQPGERLITGTHAPAGALVRLEVSDSQSRRLTSIHFTATPERKVIPVDDYPGTAVRILGELFAHASSAGP